MLKDGGLVSVGQCRYCGKTPLVDLTLFLTTKLIPIYIAGTVITPVLVAALAVAGLVQKIIEGFIKGYVIESCLQAAVDSNTPYIDRRITVASAGESPTGHRVRKRIGTGTGDNTPGFVPGGGSFGGAGAGSDWTGEPLIEPLTGLPLDWNLGTSFQVTPTESGNALRMGTSVSRPLAGYTRSEQISAFDPNYNVVARVNPDALHVVHEAKAYNGATRMVGNEMWIDRVSYGLMANHAWRTV